MLKALWTRKLMKNRKVEVIRTSKVVWRKAGSERLVGYRSFWRGPPFTFLDKCPTMDRIDIDALYYLHP